MDVSKPFTALAPTVDGDVLVVLAGSSRPRTGREIARLANRSKTGVQRVLDRLVLHGLISRQEAGEALLYVLNREHLLAPAVEQMAAARTELVNRLHSAIAAWKQPPAHASLFGSAARGDGDLDSDIDLFVVRRARVEAEDEVWRGQLDELAASARGWTGNHVGVAEVFEGDLPRLLADSAPALDEVRADGIDLAGIPLRRLLTAN